MSVTGFSAHHSSHSYSKRVLLDSQRSAMNSKKGASGNPLMDTYHVSVATDTPCYAGELSSNSVFRCQHKAPNGATFLALNCPLLYEIMF